MKRASWNWRAMRGKRGIFTGVLSAQIGVVVRLRQKVTRKRGKTQGKSGCRRGLADEFWEVGDGRVAGDGEPGAEIVPEGNSELGAGLGKAEEGVAAIAAGIAPGATAD